MGNIIDGLAISKKIMHELKEEVALLKKEKNITPSLAVILVGNNPSSKIYVRNKAKACETLGIIEQEYYLPEDACECEVMSLIKQLNEDDTVDGILLQSPIPSHLNIAKAFSKIKPEKDVDGFNPINIGMLSMGYPVYIPCTPLGVMKMFYEYNIDVEGKNCVIVGRSNIVGKPMAQLLINKSATVTICHTKTKDLKERLLNADIIISATGRSKLITVDMVKEGAIIIDIGITRKEDGTISGDVDFENVKDKASYITPVPGGVGPMTVTMLMNNVILACKNRKNESEKN